MEEKLNLKRKESLKFLRKEQKKKKSLKAARLIIRNLPFTITEEKLRESFSQFGNITETTLLKRNNKLVGCGFVQFDCKLNAAKAIAGLSGKPLLDRVIIVDWAIPKDKFTKQSQNEDVKEEKQDCSVEIKEEPVSDDELEKPLSKTYNSSNELSDSSIKAESDEDEVDDSSLKKLNHKFGKIKYEDNNEYNSKKIKKERKNEWSDDGCTLFIKNVPFSSTNDELKELVEQFGEIHYALICIDPLTEHSKGTAFVKFKDIKSANKCLNAGDSLTLKGQTLQALVAVPKDEINSKKEKKVKDRRNLYLVKEGAILAGTPAAVGISVADMDKRLKLEQWKTQKLRNLNMFVSKSRLMIHNIPPEFDDKALRQLIKKYVPSASLREVRIMRNLKDIDEKGLGRSKGFGFIGFNTHECALQVLRTINNNPEVFTKFKRPIVFFSIENRTALNIKEKAMKRNRFQKDNITNNKAGEKSETKDNVLSNDPVGNKFAGLSANANSKKLFPKHHFKAQALIHNAELKKEKRNKKMKKLGITNKRSRTKKQKMEPKMVKKAPNNDEHFSKLVDKYKSQISKCSIKKKWYE